MTTTTKKPVGAFTDSLGVRHPIMDATWEAVLAAMSEPVGRVAITCARCGGPATTAPGAITYDCPACWDDIFGY